jgi:hypothetical protein
MNIPGHCPSISIFHYGEIFMMMDNDNTGIDNAYVIETKKTCAGCGIHQSHWKENSGEGYSKGEEIYCCRDCADGVECTCNLKIEMR